MDLRTLPDGLSPADRVNERRSRIEDALKIDLSKTSVMADRLGNADEKNCEQMFGQIAVPVGYAGPLNIHLSSKEMIEAHLPLATTEGALVASVNRGCKAISMSGGAHTQSTYHGTNRSLAFLCQKDPGELLKQMRKTEDAWKKVAEATSSHLKVMSAEIEESDEHIFLTLYCDTDEAMGMNMVTIAGQAVGEWIEKNIEGCVFITVAGNVDSDKKPSLRTAERGRGYEAFAQVTISKDVITNVLKTTPEDLLATYKAKLEVGSLHANAIGSNLQAANVIAAMYLATGQDTAHVVEGSMTDTTLEAADDGVTMTVRIPAVMVGIRGGGTDLPGQSQCLAMLLKQKTKLTPRDQLAQTIAAAVLAGELSLLAAQASHTLATAHASLGRGKTKKG